ncbi:MAG: ribonuclease H-like domain-containing protein [Spirochaetales bacterium]|nr:ribonuclease H-like domain-containing protein [Spirochaetales bacterium]
MSDSFSFFKDRLKYFDLLDAKKEKKQKKKELTFTLPDSWEKVGEFTYCRTQRVESPLVYSDFSECSLIPGGYTPGSLLFFDLETTGLSGGAGNLCFLLGIGSITGKILEIRQVFLADFPGEPEFLTYISPFFLKEHLYVSYNGKSFDSHLIKNRFLLNRMECEIVNQFDLLHVSRRFFKRMIGSCSLNDIEEKVLSIHRVHDVSGFEVPDIYFDFLRTGNTEDLLRVFQHNYQDILSLVHLFNFVVTLVTGAFQEDLPAIDMSALGEYFLASGNRDGITLLEDAFRKGDARAGVSASLYYKRTEEWEKALPIWERMANETKSLFAALELAKYFEHHAKDLPHALGWVERIFEFRLPLSDQERLELYKRKERIRKKLEKEAGEQEDVHS